MNASAALTRKATGTTIGPTGTGGGNFEAVQSVTTSPATGALLVLDVANGGRLYKFTAAGAPSNFSALGKNVIEGVGGAGPTETELAVAPAGAPGGTGSDIYVANGSSALRIYAATGKLLGQLEAAGGKEVCGVATSPSGNIFVGTYSGEAASGAVLEFTPTSNPPKTSDLSGESSAPLKEICNVAAGSSGIYASQYFQKNGGTNFRGEVSLLEGIGDSSPAKIQEGSSALAIDPSNGQINIDEMSAISIRSASGLDEGRFATNTQSSTGIAVSPDGERAYVADGTSERVALFGPKVTVPDVETLGAASITETSSQLRGTIGAAGSLPATCRFEYVAEATFQVSGFGTATSVPCEPAGPFRSPTPIAVTGSLSGLSRVTTYYFRITGSNTNGTSFGEASSFTTLPSPAQSPTISGSCPSNELFRVGPSLSLPDCRAYEQVTAVDKNGGQPYGGVGYVRASSEGNGVTFYNPAGVPGGRGAQETPSFLARLTGENWSTQGLMPPQTLAPAALIKGSSPNLRFEISELEHPAKEERALYIENTETREIVPVISFIPTSSIGNRRAWSVVSVSDSGNKVFFESILPLNSGSPAGTQNLFMWERSTGAVSFVAPLPASEGGAAPPGGSFGGPYRWTGPFASPSEGGSFQGLYVAEVNAISSAETSAYFTAGGTGQIYLRQGLGSQSPSTVRVSKPNPGVTSVFGEQPAAFEQASLTGSAAFFLSAEHLTENANTGASEEGRDLYRYNAQTESLTDLTPDSSGLTPNGAEVQGVLGASEDGSVVYFVANGVLATGATPGDCPTSSGSGCNLYRYDENAVPHVTFIARLNGEEGFGGANDSFNWSPGPGVIEAGLGIAGKTSRVSENGATLMFLSTRPLTGYDNRNSEGCEQSGGRCKEIFRYFAPTQSLSCISCDPTGDRPIGSASLTDTFLGDLGGIAPAANNVNSYLVRNMTADGGRIFFQTPDPLSPADINGEAEGVNESKNGHEGRVERCPRVHTEGVALCQDVYEWEAVGLPGGSCTSAEVAGGCLYLLSGGQSGREPAFFAGANSTGSSVFFFTLSQLVPLDQDQLVDIYDARVGGGLASQHPAGSTACSGETCRSASAAAPQFETPGSASLSSPARSHRKKHRHRKPHRHHRIRHHKQRHKKRPRRVRSQSQKDVNSLIFQSATHREQGK